MPDMWTLVYFVLVGTQLVPAPYFRPQTPIASTDCLAREAAFNLADIRTNGGAPIHAYCARSVPNFDTNPDPRDD